MSIIAIDESMRISGNHIEKKTSGNQKTTLTTNTPSSLKSQLPLSVIKLEDPSREEVLPHAQDRNMIGKGPLWRRLELKYEK